MNDVKSCLLVGVGGQGAILISKIMSNGFMKAGYDVKQSEVHGMAQRGGSVSTQVRWGKKVYGPVFGKGEADIMVALEKMEAVRYAEFLNPNGVAVINDYAIKSTTIASGQEAYPQGCIEANAARGDHIDGLHMLIAHAHDGTLAEIFLYLGHRCLKGLHLVGLRVLRGIFFLCHIFFYVLSC